MCRLSDGPLRLLCRAGSDQTSYRCGVRQQHLCKRWLRFAIVVGVFDSRLEALDAGLFDPRRPVALVLVVSQ